MIITSCCCWSCCPAGKPTNPQQRGEVLHRGGELVHGVDDQPHHQVDLPLFIFFTINWSTLWFPREVTRADGREYTCVASNKFGSKVSFCPSLFIAASRVKTSGELDFRFLCPQRTSVLCRCVPRPLPLTFHLIYTTFKFHFYFQQIFNKSATSHRMFFSISPPWLPVASGHKA